MLSRLKRTKISSDKGHYLGDSSNNKDASKRQFKILSIIGLISLIILLALYSNGNLSLFSTSKKKYFPGRRTQENEEATNAILSAWGKEGEALKFANLPSSGQGYLSVQAKVQQDDKTQKEESIQIFYREASKINPMGFGLNLNHNRPMMHAMQHMANNPKLGGKLPGMMQLPGQNSAPISPDQIHQQVPNIFNRNQAKKTDDDDIVVDKDITLILLHGQFYASSTWEELGTMKFFAENGYKIYAIDMPGHGHSQKVTVLGNEWLIDVITKLVTTQDEEGNIDEDGGEHKHKNKNKKGKGKNKNKNDDDDDVSSEPKQICIISPQLSGMYTLKLLSFHEEVLGADQGIKLVKFIPVGITGIHGNLLGHVGGDQPMFNRQNDLEQMTDVLICNIGGSNDFQFTTSSVIFQSIPGAQSAAIPGGSAHVYLDDPATFHDIILRFLENDDCSYKNPNDAV